MTLYIASLVMMTQQESVYLIESLKIMKYSYVSERMELCLYRQSCSS